ncbi:MAG TPA: metalloregulator ArsR/SmtB family transcription factor [Solirubrobacteraceae bacterium]|nr:metalloregulator ArsR/SmtB family transcription factor [Solirubrobacteraceae bacterium]
MTVVPEELLDEVARLFALLSDPTRLRLLRQLHADGELAVGELAERTGVSIANVSQHLNRMAFSGLVSRRRDGRSVRYSIGDPRLEQLCDIVCAQVRERAERLAG